MFFVSLLLTLICLNEIQGFYSKEICFLKVSRGRCRQRIERWYFNAGHCQKFVYSGCGGNANSFATEQECLGTCGNICRQPKLEGTGKESQIRYYFNAYNGYCEPFDYTGCGGNENNFADFQTCRKVCQNECTLKAETGMCRAMMRRYFYDTISEKCEVFIYGGCGGNGNNFRDQQACSERCEVIRESGFPIQIKKWGPHHQDPISK